MKTAGRGPLPVAAVLAAGTLALFWPGYAVFDTVAQYRQALTGHYDDWHPPIMAALWHGLHAWVGGGAGPMLALQLGTWWAGLGGIAAGLARSGRHRGPAAVLAVGALPPFLGWQAVVLKDAQMAGALAGATGLLAFWRLRKARVPALAWAGAALLLGYAALVRANAVFAVAPLVAALPRQLHARRRAALALAATALILMAAGPINHGLFGAERSGVERTEALYDLAGIAARTPPTATLPLTPAERRAIIAKRCATPFFWDPLGDDSRCAGDLLRLQDLDAGALYGDLARAALAHPLAYARHRLSHLNSTERWLVPAGWFGAAPPPDSEPNALGLDEPGDAARLMQTIGGWASETPLGWPVGWTAVAAIALAWAVRRPAAPARDLAVALALSALGEEASFAVLSIASDLRYHLWAMTASALAIVLLADRAPPKRARVTASIGLAIVLLPAAIARLVLPRAPDSYAAMLDGGTAAAESF